MKTFNLRLHSKAWAACPLPQAQVSLACIEAAKLPYEHPIQAAVCDAVFREIERLTILQAGGFND